MVESSQQSKRGQFSQSVGLKDHAGPNAHQDNSNVLHAVKRKESFEIMFHQGVHHPK